ncbi:MFS transporter [Mycolicibacterium agri]|nr:MFS transporter [Mycolicibacterium agri]
MAGTTLPTPIYPLYADRMHFTVLTTTVIYATYAGGVLVALVLFGRWSDAIGRRPVLWAGIGFAVASAAVFLSADSVAVLLVGRVLSGLSAGLFAGTATAAVIEAAPPSWRGRASSVAAVSNVGALGIGPLLSGLLVEYAPEPLRLSFAVHIVLAVLAAVAVAIAPETSPRHGRITVQRISVPPEVRPVFLIAAVAAFAGFAVTGLFTAVAPSFLANIVGIDNHAVAGVVVGSIFAVSAVAQIVSTGLAPERAVAIGCAILAAGMVTLAVALHLSSLIGVILAAVISGVGQGISFSRGLAAVMERTPTDRRAEVSSTYFIVVYVAIALPVVGEGLASQVWGLRAAGLNFAVIVAILATMCLVAILTREARDARREISA